MCHAFSSPWLQFGQSRLLGWSSFGPWFPLVIARSAATKQSISLDRHALVLRARDDKLGVCNIVQLRTVARRFENLEIENRSSGDLGSQTSPDFFDRMDRMGGMEEPIGFVAANALHRSAEG
jgi:hypothetical protein